MASSEPGRRPFVVGIAGAAGAGKTTLSRALAAALGDATLLHIDAYQRVTEQPLDRMAQWMERGADFDEFDIPLLPAHLDRLKRGEDVQDPITLAHIPARSFIVFETHFGRAHAATGQHIDFLAWIDTPLDIALARNLRDLVEPMLTDPRITPDRSRIAWLDSYLAGYVNHVRAMALMQRDRVGCGADLVVDGSAGLADMVATVRDAVLARQGARARA